MGMMEMRRKGRPAPPMGCWTAEFTGEMVCFSDAWGQGEVGGRWRELQRQGWREAAWSWMDCDGSLQCEEKL